MRWPSAAARSANFIRSRDARFFPNTKNDAFTSRRASTSKTSGVTSGSGPLSNDSATVLIAIFASLSRDEAERIALLHDLARGRRREMSAEDLHSAVGIFLAKRTARFFRHRSVGIERVVPFGIPALNRMMHQVAGDHRVLTVRRNPHAVMAGSVTGTWLEPYFVGHAKIRIDEICHPLVDDRAH